MTIKDSDLQEKFPFLTVYQYGEEEFVGIVQNVSKTLTSVYCMNNLHDIELKKKFLELADIWYSESNRRIPINLFIKNEFDQFDVILKHYVTKEFKIISGSSNLVNIQSLNSKRIKRRKIQYIGSDNI